MAGPSGTLPTTGITTYTQISVGTGTYTSTVNGTMTLVAYGEPAPQGPSSSVTKATGGSSGADYGSFSFSITAGQTRGWTKANSSAYSSNFVIDNVDGLQSDMLIGYGQPSLIGAAAGVVAEGANNQVGQSTLPYNGTGTIHYYAGGSGGNATTTDTSGGGGGGNATSAGNGSNGGTGTNSPGAGGNDGSGSSGGSAGGTSASSTNATNGGAGGPGKGTHTAGLSNQLNGPGGSATPNGVGSMVWVWTPTATNPTHFLCIQRTDGKVLALGA